MHAYLGGDPWADQSRAGEITDFQVAVGTSWCSAEGVGGREEGRLDLPSRAVAPSDLDPYMRQKIKQNERIVGAT